MIVLQEGERLCWECVRPFLPHRSDGARDQICDTCLARLEDAAEAARTVRP